MIKQIFLISACLVVIVFLLPFVSGVPAGGDTPSPAPSETAPATPASIAPATRAPTATPTSASEPPSPPNEPSDKNMQVSALINGKTEIMQLDEYLTGVLAGEMPASFESEALKAQAIAARSYTLWRMSRPDGRHPDAQVCADPAHCQAYSTVRDGVFADAVAATDGICARYGGEPIMAVYFSASWGMTESAEAVWGGVVPYLLPVESPGEETAPTYGVKTTVKGVAITGIERDASGGVKSALLNGKKTDGAEIRRRFGLNSVNFSAEVSGKDTVVTTYGFGHGAGLSQYGANARAKEGLTCAEILMFYYAGISVE